VVGAKAAPIPVAEELIRQDILGVGLGHLSLQTSGNPFAERIAEGWSGARQKTRQFVGSATHGVEYLL
jgi:hypothetical protein